jgi:hypothetical protein
MVRTNVKRAAPQRRPLHFRPDGEVSDSVRYNTFTFIRITREWTVQMIV